MTFDDFVRRATGAPGRESYEPYGYQQRMAEGGLPDVLAVPTGAGKTLAATLPWLWRRREHPDRAVRASMPRWLVLTLPMRVLVEQAAASVHGWLKNLGLTEEVGLYRVMGGEGRVEAGWRESPEQDAVFVATMDMALSRVLNRGYGESRWAWPIDFGLLNTGVQWVFDEVQLMGPGLATSRQIEGLRRALGTAAPCRSMWMSATLRRDALVTVDNPDGGSVVTLLDDDRNGRLRARLRAGKPVARLRDVGSGRTYVRELAGEVLGHHRPGTLTLAVVNTVDRARDLFAELERRSGSRGGTGGPDGEQRVDVVLVHSRFRPPDRAGALTRALAPVAEAGPGRIVVSTQVLEAGVDVSATTMVTELAPWPSIVQRAGRCNRDGKAEGASLWWVRPPKASPYEDADLDRAADALEGLEGASASPEHLERVDVEENRPLWPVLRRRDLLELFDTLPDLSGNDVDVSRFIRDADDMDVQVAWRDLAGEAPPARAALPARDERCPVPVGALRALLAKRRDMKVWRHDHVSEAWVQCRAGDVRPGHVLIIDAREGGYDPVLGWSPSSAAPVTPVAPDGSDGEATSLTDGDTAVGDDPVTYTRRQWVSLRRHLDDVEGEVRGLVGRLQPALPSDMLEAAMLAGRYHDLGKAHQVFQATLCRSARGDDEKEAAGQEPAPWAKSGGSGRPRHGRRHFRHELASALALLGDAGGLLADVAEPDLVTYLVAAHHGRVRLGIRSLPDETVPGTADGPSSNGEPTSTRDSDGPHAGSRVEVGGRGEGSAQGPPGLFALGVWDGDELPAVELSSGQVPACRLDLSPMLLGRSADGRPSWSERALRLRDRDDLGPFRLGFLEALVRVADWRVSGRYDREQEEGR